MSASESLQEQFLKLVRRDRVVVTMFLMNGFQLRGVVTGYDSYAVILLADGKQNMIYKHAISTITPAAPVHLGPEPAAAE